MGLHICRILKHCFLFFKAYKRVLLPLWLFCPLHTFATSGTDVVLESLALGIAGKHCLDHALRAMAANFQLASPPPTDITSRAELGVFPRDSFCMSTWSPVLVWQSSQLHGIFSAWVASEQFVAVLSTPKPFRLMRDLKCSVPLPQVCYNSTPKRGSEGCVFLYVGFQWYRWYRQLHYPRSWYRK